MLFGSIKDVIFLKMIGNKRPFNKLEPVPFENVRINDNFWSKRQKINREISIHLQHKKLEENHHINNFRIAAGIKCGITKGMFYFDSDLYKWLEGACYFLTTYKDEDLSKKVEEIVDLIISSQTIDGYINTYFTTKFIEKRFTNIHIFHELYCAGHLFEAAIAHYNATNNNKLLKAAIKYANLLVRVFLGGKRKGSPGHEEIELALIALYRKTNNRKYLELAEEFINKRGKMRCLKTYVLNQNLNFISLMNLAKKRDKIFLKNHPELKSEQKNEQNGVPEYAAKLNLIDGFILFKEGINAKVYQMHKPVIENFEPVGHAVRAMYLYCGMADLFSETGAPELLRILELIWLKMIKARMYITGGIGSVKAIEGFGKDFELNPEKSYSETCAAIGNMLWNWRMLQITAKTKYADLLEKLMYNAMLVGQSIDGRKYTYSNPLLSRGKDVRSEWFICACCPPNVARTIASLGKFIYSTSDKGIWIHQYIGNETTIKFRDKTIKIKITSGFPWNGNVKINLNFEEPLYYSLFLRIPDWSKDTEIQIDNIKINPNKIKPASFLEISKEWKKENEITADFKIKPEIIYSDPRIKSTRDKVALRCGPLIYCLEQIDNENIDIFNEKIDLNQNLIVQYNKNLLGGINVILGKTKSGKTIKAIPYYAWGNRGPNNMIVWIKK